MTTRDPCSLSNYNFWYTKHTSVDLNIDFDAKQLRGSVILQIESQTDKKSEQVVLDSSFVNISGIHVNDAEAKWDVKAHSDPFGAPLHIAIPGGISKGEVIHIKIDIQTTDKCSALQWLSPSQTSNGKHPYMFSQAQPINARSIFPCQDTPDVKSPFSFRLTSKFPVIASGLFVGDRENQTASLGKETVYEFEQKVPIPAYLFAVASGDIVTARIGPRSVVATGPNELAACKWELENDVEIFLEAAEKLVFPYRWGEYNVLIMPPSFPYGGMENPIYTFATPAVISGDRQNVDLFAHEISHGWSGNLVTNCSWEHFWLNEGWTIYLQRRIVGAVNGEAEFHFSALLGWKRLEDDVEQFGKDHEYTKLIINHENVNPDDVYSTVAYEKGFHLLYYLDLLVGRDNFDKFIPHYFNKWAGKSLDSFEFRDTFMDFFNEIGDADVKTKIATIDWNDKFYTPGLPPKPKLDTTLANQCFELAKMWKDPSFEPSAKDVEEFTANQKLTFLETVQQSETPLSPERSQLLGKVYSVATSTSVEVKTSYLLIALKANDTSCFGDVVEWLGQVGRNKYVRPLLRALNKVDRQLALDAFQRHKDFYHPVCRGMVERDLGIAA